MARLAVARGGRRPARAIAALGTSPAYVLMRVEGARKSAYMEKTQISLSKEELDPLHEAAARSGRSIAALVRDAIRKVVP
jgi:hypothetical protein